MENAAQLSTLQNASGLMTSNSNLTSNCNQVNNDISTDRFLNAITTCANEFSTRQLNNINACGNISNITQRATGDFFAECYASQGILREDNTGVRSFNRADISTSQRADTSMSSMSSIIIVIVLVISGVIAFFMYKKKKAQAVS
jgi:hypothetical protein